MDNSDDLSIPAKPLTRPATPTPAAATPSSLNLGKPPVMPPRAPEPPRPAEATAMPRPIELPRRPGEASAAAAAKKPEAETRKLIVGREIALSGEITSCDRLVVEGSVEANLANCRDIDIAESGLFKGSASIDDAEIRGRFEGVLTVRGRLLIRSTGKVVGTVRYGQIEIECGGQISGDVQAQTPAAAHTGDSDIARMRPAEVESNVA
ncbi:MAG TPA: polymer-forming cytoskeletal protein [Stellaceae bacterium]